MTAARKADLVCLVLGFALPFWTLRWARVYVGPFGLSVPFFALVVVGIASLPTLWRERASWQIWWPKGALFVLAGLWLAHVIALLHGDFGDGIQVLLKLAVGTGAALLLMGLVHLAPVKGKEYFVRGLLISSAIIFLFLICYFLFGFHAPTLGQDLSYFTRAGKNQLGLALGVLFPVSLAWGARKGWRWFPVLGILAVAITYSLSRATWIAAIVGTVAVLLWESHRKRVLGQLAGAVLLSLAFLWFLYPDTGELARRTIGVVSGEVEEYSFTHRVALLRLSGGLLKAHPILGVGLGEFDRYATAESLQPVAHNDYAQVGTEQGVMGLLAFIALICYALYKGRRWRRQSVIGVFFYGLVALSAHLFFIDAYDTLWFWCIWGLTIGAVVTTNDEDRSLLQQRG